MLAIGDVRLYQVAYPPHLVRKWRREVLETVSTAHAAIVTSITDLERLPLSSGIGPFFAVMSRERAKLSYRWRPAVEYRPLVIDGSPVRDEETGEPVGYPAAPTAPPRSWIRTACR